MIRSKLFLQHFTIASLTVLGFVVVGALASVMFMKRIMPPPHSQPPIFFARLVEALDPRDAVRGLQKLQALDEDGRPPFHFALLDEKRRVLTGHESISLPADFPLPEKAHELTKLTDDRPGPPQFSVVKLSYSPARFLVMRRDPQRGPPPPPPFLRLFPPAFFTLVITVLVGIAFALFLIFRSLREHVRVADNVIGELQRGNLKARFPRGRNDEIGNAMERFNQMADEIEQLVGRLQTAESSRNLLLQGLTHDLRTPVASLRSMLETIFGEQKIRAPLDELAELSLKEVEYVSRLVEDLLLLSQVTEVKYKQPRQSFDFVALLREEGEAQVLRRAGEVNLRFHSTTEEYQLLGDEQLLRRLARNALENAFSFARGKVTIELKEEQGQLKVSIADDGPGFDPDALNQFGERRTQRAIAKTNDRRLSLGLGSVIMKTAVQLHRGEISAMNQAGGGAIVSFTLPNGR